MVEYFIEKVNNGDFDKENNKKNDNNEKITNHRENLLKKFRSYSIKIPTMIKVNGLVATLAFIKGKSENVYKHIYENINNYYTDNFNSKYNDIIKDILSKGNDVNSNSYNNIEYQRIVTTTILSYLLWVKRFSISEISYLLDNES